MSEIELDKIARKIENRQRISETEASLLLHTNDIIFLGRLANQVRHFLHPEKVVTYIVDTNINYSNICISRCQFCAFSRSPNDTDAYTLSYDNIFSKTKNAIELGATQLLLQGGLHPEYKLPYYEDMLKFIKTNFKIHIHGFSPPETVHFAKINRIPIKEVIIRLKSAGLDTIPGGGAEILVDRVRMAISPNKCTSDEWFQVMKIAHELGIKTSATMVYGHIETYEERIEHMRKVREHQDETGGFNAFIPWSMQLRNTSLENLTPTGGFEFLKMLAISRIYLDNIPHIQASWLTQGEKVGQLALLFGADDFDGTLIEESVVSSTGIKTKLSEERLRILIKEAGFIPKRRNSYYGILE